MAHSLGLRVVAEGVETEVQRRYLAEHGCDQLQGYLISRPVAADQMLPLLRGSLLPRIPGQGHPASEPRLAVPAGGGKS